MENSDLSFLNEIKNLNDQYYKAFGNLFENRNFLGGKIENTMREALYNAYKKDLKLLEIQKDMVYRDRMFDFNYESDTLVPWRFLFFKNRAGKLRLGKLSINSEKSFIAIESDNKILNEELSSILAKQEESK